MNPASLPFEVWRATDDGAECIATADDKTAAHETMRRRGDAIVQGGEVIAIKYGLHASLRRTIAHVAKYAPRDASGALIPPETPPPPAEEAPAAHEEPVTKKTETEANCTNCHTHPAAPTKTTTRAGEEGWCMHCRRNESRRLNAKPSQSPKRATKKPVARKAPRAKATPSQSPAAKLASAITARLGGLTEDEVRRIAREVIDERLAELTEALG